MQAVTADNPGEMHAKMLSRVQGFTGLVLPCVSGAFCV